MSATVLQLRVKELIAHHGSIRAAAAVLMVDKAYLYRLSTGEKDDPGADLLRRMKLRRVVTYERTDTSSEKPWPFTGCTGPLTDCDMEAASGVTAVDGETKPR